MPSSERMQWTKIRVSATVFVALLILGVFLALLTGGTLFQTRDMLRIYVPDAAGLDQDTPVRLNGIPVGRVESVRLAEAPAPDRVIEVRFWVDHRYRPQIPADSPATISAIDIQGDKEIDITRGRSAVPVQAGAELRFQPAPDITKTLDLSQFEAQLRAIDSLLADIQSGKGRVGEFYVKDDLYRSTVNAIADLQRGIRAATAVDQPVGEFIYSDAMYRRVLAPVRDLDRKLEQLQQHPVLRGTELYDDTQAKIRDMRRMLADVNAGAGAAGQFLKRDDLYAAWTRGIAAMIVSVDNFSAGPYVTGAQPYESLNGSLRDLRDTVRDFREHPQKFLRLKVF